MIVDLIKNKKRLVFFFNHSGKIELKIDKSDLPVFVFGIFVGKNKDNFKVETIQHHLSPKTFSNLLVKGVFFDQSRFSYQGLIKIEKEAQKSHAYQKNQNLIISPDCYVQSEPFLEILANDVFCTHGSTTGKLNEEEIYYLKTRGLNKKQARELLILGFLGEIFSQIEKLGFQKEILNYKNQCLRLIK